jgi:kinesin family protein 6/9
MIATLSVEKAYIDESVSTCRFSQRVALIKNEAILNEEIDPKLMVARLQSRVEELQQELLLVTGEGQRGDELTDEERESVERSVGEFIEESDPNTKLLLGNHPDMRKINLAFTLLKRDIIEWRRHKCCPVDPSDNDNNNSNGEVDKLEGILKQRDEEINVLLKMLKQERKVVGEREALLQQHRIEWNKPMESPLMGRTSPIGLARPTSITTPSKIETTPPTPMTSSSLTTNNRALIRAGK